MKRPINIDVVAQIMGAEWREARLMLRLSQTKLAEKAGIRNQQNIHKFEHDLTVEGTLKPKLATFLAPQLSQILQRRGLQLYDDSVTSPTNPPGRQAEIVGIEDLPFYEPRGMAEGIMAVGKRKGLIERPHDLVGVNSGYAFRMVGDSMWPRFHNGETLYVNPDITQEIGMEHVFYTPNRDQAQVGVLKEITDTHWVVTRYEKPTEELRLRRKAPAKPDGNPSWPDAQRIILHSLI